MHLNRHDVRAGMTLVELLVVVSILVLLSAAVLPNLAGRKGSRALQIAAANVSGQFAKSQSLAISRRVLDLYFAGVPEPYRGDTFDAKFSVTPVASGTAMISGTPAGCAASLSSPAFGNFANPGNLIQFNDAGPLYDFRITGGGTTATFRATASQTGSNTLWPASAPSAHRFAIYRLPTRAGQPLTLAAGTAIDMVWSGVGTRRFGEATLGGDAGWTCDPDYAAACAPGSPGSPRIPATVVALFNPSGALDEMCYIANSSAAATTRFAVSSPLYLLVGRVDRCGLPYNPAPTEDNPGANWQYPESRWIAIDPKTGVIKSAEPVNNATTALDS